MAAEVLINNAGWQAAETLCVHARTSLVRTLGTKQYIQEHDIRFPILIDKQGVIRHVRIGEGGYQETERLIQSLLAETF